MSATDVTKIISDLLILATNFGMPWLQLVGVLKANGLDDEAIAQYEKVIADKRTFRDFHGEKPAEG